MVIHTTAWISIFKFDIKLECKSIITTVVTVIYRWEHAGKDAGSWVTFLRGVNLVIMAQTMLMYIP